MASIPTQTIICLQLLIFLIGSCSAMQTIDGGVGGVVEAEEEVQERQQRQEREFDYFMLALQWPGTQCLGTHRCCSSNACCRGSNSPTEFTIHGLWPDYNDGTWPSCCTGSSFDAKEISTLHDALEKYWPSYKCGLSSTCHGKKGLFWAHEWEKHGTCSFPVFHEEYNYFLTTLNVYFKYNVTAVLREAGYVPSNSEKYPIGGIISAIQNAFHATPELMCSHGAVEELRLCFYKDFTPRDCATTSNIQRDVISSTNSCPNYVSLPAYVSLGLKNNENTVPWSPQNEVL